MTDSARPPETPPDPFLALQEAVGALGKPSEWDQAQASMVESIVGELERLLAAKNTPVTALKVHAASEVASRTVARLYALVGSVLLQEIDTPLVIDIPEGHKAILDPEAREGLDNLTDGFQHGEPLYDSHGNARVFESPITEDALNTLADVVLQQSSGHLICIRTMEKGE